MSTRKKFTPDEIKQLKANPYTQHAPAGSQRLILQEPEAAWIEARSHARGGRDLPRSGRKRAKL